MTNTAAPYESPYMHRYIVEDTKGRTYAYRGETADDAKRRIQWQYNVTVAMVTRVSETGEAYFTT